jgi:hypothetical protein
MKHYLFIVLALVAMSMPSFATDAKPQPKPAPSSVAPPAETLETVKLSEIEQLKVQSLQQQRTILLQQQQILQKQFNDTQAALQKLTADAKVQFEQIAKDHKIKDVEFDVNTFGLAPAKQAPTQNAGPSASK